MKLNRPGQNNWLRVSFILLLVVSCTTEVFPANDQPIPETLLLKDFRPRSIYKVPQTTVKKARYPAIDMHGHAYTKTPEQTSEWVRIMDETGIDKTVILTGETGKEFELLLPDIPSILSVSRYGVDLTIPDMTSRASGLRR